ncbi:MAG: DUF547 domain-containing protein [Aurantibacter sp.]
MYRKFILILTFVPFVLMETALAETPFGADSSITMSNHRRPDHSSWNVLLQKYVDTEGNVNYAGLAKDKGKLEAYLQYLNQNAPSEDWPKNEKLAYYINLYNAATVKLIVDNYPLESIKDLRNPWDSKWVLIGGKKYSLGNIEHKILRKMNEPRIHFAINCASYSCPKLVNKAFLRDTMEEQLEDATIDFINDSSRNVISENKIKLSNIFKWYKGDFTEGGSLIDYLNRYSKTKAGAKAKISYLTYDWGLNESR